MRFHAELFLQHLHADLSTFITEAPSWAPDNTPLEVSCFRLKESVTKKLCQTQKPSRLATDAAMEKFLAVNERCEKWEMCFNYEWEEVLINLIKIEIEKFWFRDGTDPLFSDYRELFFHGRAGPGASISATGTDFYQKMFESPLTSTKGLSHIWESCIAYNPQFREAYSEPVRVSGIQEVDGNKLSFVKKTQQIARSICTEPTINMWFQLGLGEILHRRLRQRYAIDFTYQPEVNRTLARLGSILDHIGTIDLESASDSMSNRMLKYMLPSSFYAVLQKLRSPLSRLPNGSLVQLNMVSTMGNGFTFPLQTLLFSAVVASAFKLHGLHAKWRSWVCERNASVFGDDIIVDKRVYRTVLRGLHLLGFVVNESKSFVEGPFRESCGADYFNGVNVRPVYLKQVNTLQDTYVAINTLNRWSAQSGVPLRRCITYLMSLDRSIQYSCVPPDEADTAGVIRPWEMIIDRLKRSVGGSFGLLKYDSWEPVSFGYRVTASGGLRGSVKLDTTNPRGLEIAFIGGYISGYRVSVRQTETRYKTKRKCTPSWGHLRPDTLSEFPDRAARLLRASVANFG
jgi:hypothetical protein